MDTDLVLLGKIVKTHGIQGGVILKIDSSFPEYIEIDNLSEAFQFSFSIFIDGGHVPFFPSQNFPTSIRFQNTHHLIIYFDTIHNETLAKTLIHHQVYIDRNRLSDEEVVEDQDIDYKSYTITDINFGYVGVVSQLLNYSGNLLFEVFNGDTEILVPANSAVIQSIDDLSKTILVDTPEGLIELYLDKSE